MNKIAKFETFVGTARTVDSIRLGHAEYWTKHGGHFLCVVATINILAFSRSFYLIQDGLMSLSHSICCIVYSLTYCS